MMKLWEMESTLTRGVYIRPEFVAIAGDLAGGALLCQIIYWCKPDKSGASKLRVQRDGRYWIAKTCEFWCQECCITEKQYRRVCRHLQAIGVIERKVKKFAGHTMTHTSLNEEVLAQLLRKQLAAPSPETDNLIKAEV